MKRYIADSAFFLADWKVHIYMNGILYAFLGTLFTFFVTSLGALNVFLVRKNTSGDTQCAFLGFAGGVMTAASIWSLLIPAIERANDNGQISWLVVSGGFLSGVLLLLLADGIIRERIKRRSQGREVKKGPALFVLAITVHNIPEGMAVGLAFALAAQNMQDYDALYGAIALALGIGIQNYPEGAAVALPLYRAGYSKKKAFLYGSMSAAVEPAAAVIAAALAGFLVSVMPLLLSLAAGTMIYVVVEELIPEAHMGEKKNIGTLGFIVGFLIMMILDVALG